MSTALITSLENKPLDPRILESLDPLLQLGEEPKRKYISLLKGANHIKLKRFILRSK